MKFHFQSRALLFSCLLLLGPAALAQPVQDRTLNRLIELSNLNSMVIQSSHDMRPIFDTQAEDILKANLAVSTLNQQQKNAALKISRLLQATNESIVSDPQFLHMIRKNFQKAFTEEEAQAYIAFLSTPMGQSINQKSAGLMNSILQETMTLSASILNDSQRQQNFNEKLASILQPLLSN